MDWYEATRLSADKINLFLNEDIKYVAFDIETSNDLTHATPEILSYFKKGTRKYGLTYLANLTHLAIWTPNAKEGVVFLEEDLQDQFQLDFLYDLFCRRDVIFVGHNLVFDLRLLCGHIDLPVPVSIWDTYTNELIFADSGLGFENVTGKSFSLKGLLDFYSIPYDETYNLAKDKRARLHLLDREEVIAYVVNDVKYAALVMLEQMKRVASLRDSYPHVDKVVNYENRFNRVMAHMTSNGIALHLPRIRTAMEETQYRLLELRQKMTDLIRHFYQLLEEDEINGDERKLLQLIKSSSINPNAHLDQSMYWRAVGIVIPPYSKPLEFLYTGGGKSGIRKSSFDKEALEYYAARYGDAINDYLEFKRLEKFLEKLHELYIHASRDGKIHSLINTNTITGRTSSSQPNMQNIRMGDFAGMFIAAPGRVLLELDISNAETYMAAMMAKDDDQMAALYSGDYHSIMAAKYFPAQWNEAKEKDKKEIIKRLRDASKPVTFGTAYTMGAARLAQNPKLEEVTRPSPELIDRIKYSFSMPDEDNPYAYLVKYGWLREMPLGGERIVPNESGEGIKIEYVPPATDEDWKYAARITMASDILREKDKAFPKTVQAKTLYKDFAKRYGFVELWTGRRVYVDNPKNAWNCICQGGVGELTRRWLVLIFENIIEKYPELDTKIVCFIHDAVIIDVPIAFAEFVSKLSGYLLASVIETEPLDRTGMHWYERTTPRGRYVTSLEHESNAKKWGKHPDKPYPFDLELQWSIPTKEEIKALKEQVLSPQYLHDAFYDSLFVLPEHEPKGGAWGEGLSLPAYIGYLEDRYTISQDDRYYHEAVALQKKALELSERVS